MRGPIVALDHAFVTIPEGGEDEARRFYVGALALHEIERPEGLRERGGVWFRAGDQELHVGADDAHVASRRPHPGFRVDSVTALEKLARSLENDGYKVEWDDRIEGRARFYTRDPFGNRVELLADL